MSVVFEQPVSQPTDIVAGLAATSPPPSEQPLKPRTGHLGGLAHLDLASGADNLIGGCIDARPGERLLVVREDSRHGFYDCAAPAFVADYARVIGLDVVEMDVAGHNGH